ncbi:MAG: dihydroorotase family protein [Chloroflexaceae bacterium]|jgi:allantoinase|nr:dihydroorotase family protein [Chloroflexaceae bacterium]
MLRLDLAIVNGTLIDEQGRREADIGIADGRVAQVAAAGTLAGRASAEIDATSMWVLPGIVDAHFHCRAPDHPEREDFASGTAAAAAGGITTLFEMPIAEVGVARAEVLRARQELAEREAYIDFALFGALGSLDRHTIHELAAAGAIGFKSFTLHPPPDRRRAFEGIDIVAEDQLFTALSLARETGLVCAIHAENDALLRLHYASARSQRLSGPAAHMHAHPVVAEAMAVAWMGVLSEATGARVHIVHVTSRWALDLIRLARQRGANLTAETCPHYLLFDEATAHEYGPWAKISPPLRTAADREALWAALGDGTLDFIASDHAPFLPEEKEISDMLAVPSGLPNVEVFPPLMLSAALEGRMPLEHMVGLLTARPARIYGIYPQKGALLPGSDADVLIYDPRPLTQIEPERWHSKSRGSGRVFAGMRHQGRVARTIVRGRTVYAGGELVGPRGWGRMVRPGKLQIE